MVDGGGLENMITFARWVGGCMQNGRDYGPVLDYIGAPASRTEWAAAGRVQSKGEPLRQKMITFDYIENIFCGGVEKPPTFSPHFSTSHPFLVAAVGTMKEGTDNGFFTTKTP
jgi:hypothetical protein